MPNYGVNCDDQQSQLTSSSAAICSHLVFQSLVNVPIPYSVVPTRTFRNHMQHLRSLASAKTTTAADNSSRVHDLAFEYSNRMQSEQRMVPFYFSLERIAAQDRDEEDEACFDWRLKKEKSNDGSKKMRRDTLASSIEAHLNRNRKRKNSRTVTHRAKYRRESMDSSLQSGEWNTRSKKTNGIDTLRSTSDVPTGETSTSIEADIHRMNRKIAQLMQECEASSSGKNCISSDTTAWDSVVTFPDQSAPVKKSRPSSVSSTRSKQQKKSQQKLDRFTQNASSARRLFHLRKMEASFRSTISDPVASTQKVRHSSKITNLDDLPSKPPAPFREHNYILRITSFKYSTKSRQLFTQKQKNDGHIFVECILNDVDNMHSLRRIIYSFHNPDTNPPSNNSIHITHQQFVEYVKHSLYCSDYQARWVRLDSSLPSDAPVGLNFTFCDSYTNSNFTLYFRNPHVQRRRSQNQKKTAVTATRELLVEASKLQMQPRLSEKSAKDTLPKRVHLTLGANGSILQTDGKQSLPHEPPEAALLQQIENSNQKFKKKIRSLTQELYDFERGVYQ